MASANVTLKIGNLKSTTVEMVIVGGGLCGVLAAKQCYDKGISYKLIERNPCLGGNWHTLANNYSHLQAFEPNYRWDENYKLNPDPLTKNSAPDVLNKLNEYANDHEVLQNTLFNTEVVTVRENAKGSKYQVVIKNLETNDISTIKCGFLCVTCGILSTQFSAEERGIKDTKKFKGITTFGGKHEGVDCAAGNTDLTGKRVVILGTGSFAAEALEAAERSNAEHITVIGRPRYRWILPFSRQYVISTFANAPLLPWSLKTKMALWYVRKAFYEPCGLEHWMPENDPALMDYSGQCNDGYFRLAFNKTLTCKLGAIERMEAHAAVLATGEKIPCDMLVVASGCKYNLNPPFLRELNVGFGDLHNFAFLGKNPRIGCASDFVFAYVPFGPIKQLEMFFHAVECCRNNLEDEVTAALEPTPLPNHGEGRLKGGRMAGHYTFFEYDHWWSVLSKAQQARVDSMFRTLDVGRSTMQKLTLRITAAVANTLGWVQTVVWGMQELYRYPMFGPGVTDHHIKHDGACTVNGSCSSHATAASKKKTK